MAAGTATDTEEITFIRSVIDQGKIAGLQFLVIGISLLLNMLDGFDVTAMCSMGLFNRIWTH